MNSQSSPYGQMHVLTSFNEKNKKKKNMYGNLL